MDKSIEHLEQKIDNLEILVGELIEKLDGLQHGDSDIFGNMEECARWIKRSPSTIYKLTSQKRIPHIRNGKRLLFKKAEIEEWLENDRQATLEDLRNETDHDLQRHAKSPWKPGIYK
jgi:excisionase family DNA binding protein